MNIILDRYIGATFEGGKLKFKEQPIEQKTNVADLRKVLQDEADVIVTATILGFIGTRQYLAQPCRFDFQNPNKEQAQQWYQLDKYGKKEYIKILDCYDVEQSIWKDQAQAQQALNDINTRGQTIFEETETRENGPYQGETWIELTLNDVESYSKELKEYYDFLRVLDALSIALKAYGDSKGIWQGEILLDGQAPSFMVNPLITGTPGGERAPYSNELVRTSGSSQERGSQSIEYELVIRDTGGRGRSISEDKIQEYRDRAEAEGLYNNRGAYTGIVDDPENAVQENTDLLAPTKRVLAGSDTGLYIPPQRDVEGIWGLIGDNGNGQSVNLDASPTGLGPLPRNSSSKRVGYIHGMSTAIIDSIRRGPWTTPFELAIGTKTTKIASCFACTTYMYAAGYPPSSSHLGRGEAWLPPQTNFETGMEMEQVPGAKAGLPYDSGIVSAVVKQWHRQVFAYMELGIKVLEHQDYKQVNEGHKAAVRNMQLGLQNLRNLDKEAQKAAKDPSLEAEFSVIINTYGGNIFLDALTVFESDWKRIKRTLAPAFDESGAEQAQAAQWAKALEQNQEYLQLIGGEAVKEFMTFLEKLLGREIVNSDGT